MPDQGNRQATLDLLRTWAWRAKRAGLGHYETARILDRRHYSIGTALVFSSVASTSLAGRALFGVPAQDLTGLMTIASVFTLIGSCLHVFLQDANRAERYRRMGSRYTALKREIEQRILELSTATASFDAAIADIRLKLDNIGEEAPPIPNRIWKRISRTLDSTKRRFEQPDKHSLQEPGAR